MEEKDKAAPEAAKDVVIAQPPPAPVGFDVFNPKMYEQAMEMATTVSKSLLIPTHYRDKPADCFIAIYRAQKLGLDIFGFMEQAAVVKGKVFLQGQLVTALINKSGKIQGSLRFEYKGKGETRSCTVWGISTETGERIEETVTVQTAKDMGWWAQNALWKNMTDRMLGYRAASWFGRSHMPETLLGFGTEGEEVDTGKQAPPPKTLFKRPEQAVTATATEEPVAQPVQPEPAQVKPDDVEEAQIVDEKEPEETAPPKSEPKKHDAALPFASKEDMLRDIISIFGDTPERLASLQLFAFEHGWITKDQPVGEIPGDYVMAIYNNKDQFDRSFSSWKKPKDVQK